MTTIKMVDGKNALLTDNKSVGSLFIEENVLFQPCTYLDPENCSYPSSEWKEGILSSSFFGGWYIKADPIGGPIAVPMHICREVATWKEGDEIIYVSPILGKYISRGLYGLANTLSFWDGSRDGGIRQNPRSWSPRLIVMTEGKEDLIAKITNA